MFCHFNMNILYENFPGTEKAQKYQQENMKKKK